MVLELCGLDFLFSSQAFLAQGLLAQVREFELLNPRALIFHP